MENSIHPWWLIGICALAALLPLVAGAATSYLKVSVVLGMLKSALGTQHAPSGMVVSVLSIAISIFVMAPVFEESWGLARHIKPEILQRGPTLEDLPTLARVFEPWRAFLRKHCHERELQILRGAVSPVNSAPVDEPLLTPPSEKKINAPTTVALLPGTSKVYDLAEPLGSEPTPLDASFSEVLLGFVLSQLKEAFLMGFMLLLPFLVIDLLVGNILSGLGLQTMSPLTIALPLKLALFVACDGWVLLTRALIQSY